MTQMSYWWSTSGTPAGDQVASYTQAHLSKIVEIVAACSGFEGVAPNYLNELACSANGANTVAVNTGGAVVDGKPYLNDASVDVNIPSAVGGGNTRIDRLVLRASWAGFDIAITRIAGTDAASPTAPAITQTTGTTYDIQLCQVLVDTSGAVTVTDERVWALVDVDESTIESSAGQLRVKDSGITAAKIANRSRSFLVPAFHQLAPGGSPAYWYLQPGLYLRDNTDITVYGHFFTPADFASGLTVKAVVAPETNGNIYSALSINYAAAGQAYSTHSASHALDATALTQFVISAIKSTSLASLAAGDYVMIQFSRSGSDPSDTTTGVYLLGFLVEYTADS